MKLVDIATIADIASSGALAVSLVYLALQVRQAEKNQRGLTQQGRANRLTNLLMQISEPQNAAIWIKGMHAPQSLAGEELERYLLMCRSGFTSMEDSFLQHKAGLLEEAAFNSITGGVRGQLSSSGMRAAWVLLSHQFGPDFVAYVNEQLATTKLQSPEDRLQRWKSAIKTASEQGVG
jgi:hypothetical protein